MPAQTTLTGNGASKLPPTGPRAYKKPRLSEPHTSPPPRSNASLPPSKPPHHSNSARINHLREQSPRPSSEGQMKASHTKMEIDEDLRKRPRSPADRNRDRDRDHGRDHERVRERERDRDRDRERVSRRNANGGGGGRGGGRRADRGMTSNSYGSGDRTLAERMGL